MTGPDLVAIQRCVNVGGSVLRELAQLVETLGEPETDADQHLETRARIGELRAEFDQALNDISSLLGVPSARTRLLRYLSNHVGEVVGPERLAGVAGIVEFPRRLRELRVEEGWSVRSAEDRADLRPGQCVLESSEQGAVRGRRRRTST